MPMNYTVTGWAAEDADWFTTARDTEASFLKFTVLNAVTHAELDESKRYDPVGRYIIVLQSNTAASHEIGSNYDITVLGEWSDDTYFTEQNGKAGSYTVNPRVISITMFDASGEYGDGTLGSIAAKIEWTLNSTLADGETLDDLKRWLTVDVSDVFLPDGHTKSVGNYTVRATLSTANYTLDGTITAQYKIVPREINIRVLDQDSEYGDWHSLFVASKGHDVGWVAERTYADADGIAYPTDQIVTAIKLTTGIADTVFVDDYANAISVVESTLSIDGNYHINGVFAGTLHVVPRQIAIHVNSQTSEYGEEHVFSKKYGNKEEWLAGQADWYADRLNKTEFSDNNVVVLDTDINAISLSCDIDRTSPAGTYQLNAAFNNPNYKAVVVEGEYTITKREITVIILNSSSEYGDALSTLDYQVSRTGGNALVNGDVLDITLAAVKSNGAPVDEHTAVGTYPIIVSASNNANYEITFAGNYEGVLPDGRVGDAAGIYTVNKRRIVITFSGESEYGDPYDPHGASYRADGKSGPAIVNGDDLGYTFEWIDDPQSYLSGAYPAVGDYKLRVHKPETPTPAQSNYEILDDESGESVYRIVPRRITLVVKDLHNTYGEPFDDPEAKISDMVEAVRTSSKPGDAILNNDIQYFSLKVIDGDVAKLTEGRPFYVGSYNYNLRYTSTNRNYEITVDYGNYIVDPRPVTVHIDSKTSKYGEDIEQLTFSEVQGLLDGDDLNIELSVLWLDELLGLEFHNTGIYAISAKYDNPNYSVTFDGALGKYGAYDIEKADNLFTKGYTGDGEIDIGDPFEADELPTAKWGNDGVRLEYYLDEAMTQLADFDDIVNASTGTYYVKVTVDESLNWKSAVTSFVVNVVNKLSLPDGLDITAYVLIYASQFVILTCALIFIKRRKGNKNKKTNNQ